MIAVRRCAFLVAAVAVSTVFSRGTAVTARQPAAAQPVSPGPMRGYSPAAAAVQRAIENRFRALPAAESIRVWHRYFTKTPHPATSPRTKEIAEYIAAQWKAQGLDEVYLRRYDVLSSNPRTAADCGDAGSATTIGLPESPPSRIAGSIGTRPRNGIPSLAAALSPPPCENISVRSPQ